MNMVDGLGPGFRAADDRERRSESNHLSLSSPIVLHGFQSPTNEKND